MEISEGSFAALKTVYKSDDTIPAPESELRTAAAKLESTFLGEMLKSIGYGKTPSAFGGGDGEDQFASFLVQAQADKIVESGGIGLAEVVFEALKERAHGTS